jgi:hypothetical protein
MKYRSYVVENKINNNIQNERSEKNNKNCFEEIFFDKKNDNHNDNDMENEISVRKELFIIYNENKILTNLKKTIRIYSLPFMTCTHVLTDILNFSCFEISYTLHWFCTCHNDGTNRLYEVVNDDIRDKLIQFRLIFENDIDNDEFTNNRIMTDITTNLNTKTMKYNHNNSKNNNEIKEVMYSSTTTHSDKITSVTFNDKLKVYVTSSLDCSIRIWNYKKCQLNCLLFQNPSVNLLFYGDGDILNNILISQKSYLLNVDKTVWDYNNNVKNKKNEDGNGFDDDEKFGNIHEIVDLFLLKEDVNCLNHILMDDDINGNISTQKDLLDYYNKQIDAKGDEILIRIQNNLTTNISAENLNTFTLKNGIGVRECLDLIPPPVLHPKLVDTQMFPNLDNNFKSNNKNLNHKFDIKLVPLNSRVSGKLLDVRIPNILTRCKFSSESRINQTLTPQNNLDSKLSFDNHDQYGHHLLHSKIITENEGILNKHEFNFETNDNDRFNHIKENHIADPELVPLKPKQIKINHSKSSFTRKIIKFN